jgi:leucyl-tRNA synthetase
LRAALKVPADIAETEMKEQAMQNEKVKIYLSGKEIRKVIFVKGRLINFVIT